MFDRLRHGLPASWRQRVRAWCPSGDAAPAPRVSVEGTGPPSDHPPPFAIRQRLACRLVLLIVLASSCITLLITGAQLVLEYRHLRGAIDQSFERIEPLVPGLTQQLWELNVEHLQLSVAALGNQSKLQVIRVRDQTGVVLAEAVDGGVSRHFLRRVFELRHQGQGAHRHIGTLEVYASLDPIHSQLLNDAVVLVLGNLLKTLLMVGIMLAILQRHVSARLSEVAGRIGAMLAGTLPELRLRAAARPAFDDEIELLDHMARVAHNDIQSLVAQLRSVNGALQVQVAEQQNHLRTVSLLEEVVVQMDVHRTIIKASDGWHRVLPGLGEIVGKNIACLLLREEDVVSLLDIMCSFEGGEDSVQTLRFLSNDNASRHAWIEFRVLPRHDAQGAIVGYVGVLQDVTKRQDFDIAIAHMALHDPLTALPNRSLLDDRLQVALKACERQQHRLAVLSVDIDNFKSINDGHGHKTGDKLLIAFSQRLQAQLRGDETVARWSGDEFTVLLPHVVSVSDLAARIDTLHQSLRRVYVLAGEHIALTTSLGVALFPDDGRTPDDLMYAAELAKSVAKAHGRNQILWAEELRGRQEQRHNARIRQRLTMAVERGEIQAWMQPIVRSGSRTCDRIEVLARWHDAELGWVGPEVFIPLAEDAGLIDELGRSVWNQAVAQLGAWRARGIRLQASFNVSGRQLCQQDFAAQLLASLARHGVPPQAMVLEITESVALRDDRDVALRLAELSDAGFALALDDFGTGHVSLPQLHDMPLRELKIDISLVRRIDTPVGASMIDTLIKLAEVMGLSTTAEGVETLDVADTLERMGASRLQGFALGRPMCAADFERWHAENSRALTALPHA